MLHVISRKEVVILLFCQIMLFCLGSWCALPGSRSAAELHNLSLLLQEVALSRFGPKEIVNFKAFWCQWEVPAYCRII